MEYPQNLSYYIHNFENIDWIKKETNHYIFYYQKNSVAERDIEHIVNIQEKAFQKITLFLKLSKEQLPEHIYYYFYSDKEIKKKLMGDDWYAQAIYNKMIVHMLYTDEIKPIGPHEDTHLLSLPLGLAIGFIQEGLAEYMVGHDWYGNNLDQTTREGLKNNFIKFTPELLFMHKGWSDNVDNNENIRYYYALAGSFVEFLIKEFGKNKFLTLYKKLKREYDEENKKLYSEIFGKDTKGLIKLFIEHLSLTN